MGRDKYTVDFDAVSSEVPSDSAEGTTADHIRAGVACGEFEDTSTEGTTAEEIRSLTLDAG